MTPRPVRTRPRPRRRRRPLRQGRAPRARCPAEARRRGGGRPRCQLARELVAATDRPMLGVGVGTPGVVDAGGRGPRRAQPRLGTTSPWPASPRSLGPAGPRRQRRQRGRARRAHLRRPTPAQTCWSSRSATVSAPACSWTARSSPAIGSRPARSATSSSTSAAIRAPAAGRGCLETVLAVPLLRAAWPTRPTTGRGAGPRPAAGRRLGIALAPVVSALDLDAVVLSGPADLLDEPLPRGRAGHDPAAHDRRRRRARRRSRSLARRGRRAARRGRPRPVRRARRLLTGPARTGGPATAARTTTGAHRPRCRPRTRGPGRTIHVKLR